MIDILLKIGIALYAIIGIVSSIILARWLHKNRHQELGETWLTEIPFGIMFGCLWPVSIPLMIANDRHE